MIVTVDVQVLVFPEPSVAVTVTELAPTSLHVKDDVLTWRLLTEQLSELLLVTSPLVMLAFPVPSRKTLMF